MDPVSTIVVGIDAGQADAVVLVAAELAARLDADLVCVVVDESSYTITDRDGRAVVAPIDPDAVDDGPSPADTAAEHLHAVLDRVTTGWSVRAITGDPAAGLAAVAQDVDALMIVLGTNRRTVARSVREFFAGSIAAYLAHRQPRPILVVPLDPSPPESGVPWWEDRG